MLVQCAKEGEHDHTVLWDVKQKSEVTQRLSENQNLSQNHLKYLRDEILKKCNKVQLILSNSNSWGPVQ